MRQLSDSAMTSLNAMRLLRARVRKLTLEKPRSAVASQMMVCLKVRLIHVWSAA